MVPTLFGTNGNTTTLHLDDIPEHWICGRTRPSSSKCVLIFVSQVILFLPLFFPCLLQFCSLFADASSFFFHLQMNIIWDNNQAIGNLMFHFHLTITEFRSMNFPTNLKCYAMNKVENGVYCVRDNVCLKRGNFRAFVCVCV